MFWNLNEFSNNVAAITESGKICTYQELDRQQKKLSELIPERHLTYLQCSTTLECITIYISCIQNNIPIALADGSADIIYTNRFINLYQPDYLWLFTYDEVPEGYKQKYLYEGYMLCERKIRSDYNINNNLALLLSTSGSTGSNKNVMISYKNLRSNTEAIIKSLDIRPEDAAILMLPVSYTYGLSVINTYLYAGARLLIPKSKFYSKSFWDFFNNNMGTAICGVPYTYELLQKLNFANIPLPTLKLATQAGGKMDINTTQYFLNASIDMDFNLAIMYGQTEATARMSCFILNKHPDKIMSVGKALNDGSFTIDESNSEILYSGPNVSLGYSNSYSDLDYTDNDNGILHTGDIGYIDSDGYLYITGRIKRIVKIRGYRISLDDLESCILQKLGIKTICIEKDDQIFIVLDRNYSEKKSSIIKYIQYRLKITPKMVGISYIPRKSSGKIDYIQLDSIIQCQIIGG